MPIDLCWVCGDGVLKTMQLSRASRFIRQLKQQLVLSVHDSSLLRKEELHECSQESRQSRTWSSENVGFFPECNKSYERRKCHQKRCKTPTKIRHAHHYHHHPGSPTAFPPTSQSRYSRGQCRSKNMYICVHLTRQAPGHDSQQLAHVLQCIMSQFKVCLRPKR
jgi:hypothetical protein